MASNHEGKSSPDIDGHGDSPDSRNEGTNSKDGTSPPHDSILSRAKRLWAKAGITPSVAKLMFKGALAPTIVIAAYQSDAWAHQYSTLGYLIGIMAQLSIVIQPRAKFLQTMLVQVLLVSLAAALATLASFCIIHARISSEGFEKAGTGGPGTSGTASRNAETTTYNSSASAVAGIWLFVEIYGISAFKAYYPRYTVPCIQFAILTNVAMSYAPQFGTMAQAETFVLGIWSAILTGFAVATGVSLLVFPLTSRHVYFNDVNGMMASLRSALGANQRYLNSLEHTDMFAAQRTNTAGEKPIRSPEAEAVWSNLKAASANYAKSTTDLTFAVREIAFGRLGPDDLKQLNKLIREIFTPMVGLSCLSDIFDRISISRGWDRRKSFPNPSLPNLADMAESGRLEAINEWHELIKVLKEPFESLTTVIDDGLEHVALTLRLTKQRQKSSPSDDREEAGDTPKPGDPAFADYLARRAEEFQRSKQVILRTWCGMHNIELPEGFFENPKLSVDDMPAWTRESSSEHSRLRNQLMVLLYVEFLLWTLARKTHNLVVYADSLKAAGKVDKRRLIVPGFKRLRKWFWSALRDQDADDHDYSETMDVSLGQAYKRRKDPEHLPPQTAWQKFSVVFQKLGDFFGSSKSMFGFRVAVATMCIAVINLLHVSQVFFTKERLFWAQIMASIAMSPSAGQSLRTFILRISGTAAAMVVAMIAYYIVDGHAAGALVFYFLFQLPGIWILVKKPALTTIGMIGPITLTLIIGYELQVEKIGIKLAEANGQEYYPIYELAPIRLLTVMAGIFVAWIFTLFPYPITEHSQLRKNTATTLYLLANYYSAVDETVKLRFRGWKDADEKVKGSATQKLAKARATIFAKCNTLLAGMRAQTAFVKYDLPIGGPFPKEQYQALADKIQSTLNFMALISIASAAFATIHEDDDEDSNYMWVRNFRKLIGSANLTSHSVTTLLSLLSASLGNGQPLPPYLRAPERYSLVEKMDELDPQLLSVRHVAEPGYASFAVVQIALNCMMDELKELLDGVRNLVGELDFSFHVVSSGDSSMADLRDGVEKGDGRDKLE